jgi:hypothetical protein
VSDPRLYEWIAPRRIAGGGGAKSAEMYFDHGRPVPVHMIPVFDRLRWSGLFVIADSDPLWDLRRISLTAAGRVRYEALAQQRERTRLQAPTPEFGRGQIPGASSDDGGSSE